MTKRVSLFTYLTLLLMTILLPVSVQAEVKFQLLPRQNVIANQSFPLTFRLTLENESTRDITMPKAPELEGCRLLSGPNSTSSQQQETYINGKRTSLVIIDLTCVYRARSEGKVTVPPVSINVGGKTYSSNSSSFEILPPDSDPSAGNYGNGRPSGNTPGASATGTTAANSTASAKDFFVRVFFSKSSVYEQEGVIAITKLYRPASHKFSLNLEAVPRTPVYEGFLSEDLEANPEGQIENYNGKNYITYELSRVLLFPQKAGELKVTSGVYTLKIREQTGTMSMGWFGTATYDDYSYTTPMTTATLHVKALPEPRPADFCGAVGSFSLESSLSPEILRTNESATYSLIFKGSGNVKYLTVPTVEFPVTFDKYSAKTDVNARVSGQTYAGTYRVDYPLVPQEMGNYAIPAQTFSYFNLQTGHYETLSTETFDVKVERGSTVSVASEQKAIDAEMNDIVHIHSLPSTIARTPDTIFGRWWYWSLWGLVFISLVIAVIAYRRYIRLSSDVTGRKEAKAGRVAEKRLKSAAACMKNHDSQKFYTELASALKGYISDKLAMPQSQLISAAISEKLARAGVGEQTITSVLDVLDQCEMARFTPSDSEKAMQDLYTQASVAVKEIEEAKKHK
ncbi:MAG: BatD family protein [Muribaculaceae bacterium]|nr:BatD family protein [Muribaculaceae bacterium]